MDVVGLATVAVGQLACVICNWLNGACTGLGCVSQGPGVGDLALGVGAVAAATVVSGIYGGAFTAGAVARAFHDAATYDPGDHVTTYVPGISPPPDVGDIIYSPDLGASTVKAVYSEPSAGGGTVVTVVTELGTVQSETRPTTTQDPGTLPHPY